MKDINVIGTMQLLGACQRVDSVRHVVVKSTAAVYGSGPRDPALITEDSSPRHPPTSGWAKDSMEVEEYVRGFARRRPDGGGDSALCQHRRAGDADGNDVVSDDADCSDRSWF